MLSSGCMVNASFFFPLPFGASSGCHETKRMYGEPILQPHVKHTLSLKYKEMNKLFVTLYFIYP